MTIVQPHKNNLTAAKISILFLTTALITSVLGWMFFYNQFVNLRHDLEAAELTISKAEVENAELKNDLYKIIDVKNLEVLAQERSLVVDKNPKYFKLERVVASQ
jgi:hypothetical protein